MAKGKGGQSQKKDKETKEQRKARLQAEKQSIEQVRQSLDALCCVGRTQALRNGRELRFKECKGVEGGERRGHCMLSF
jgi:hypothetical protein